MAKSRTLVCEVSADLRVLIKVAIALQIGVNELLDRAQAQQRRVGLGLDGREQRHFTRKMRPRFTG